MTNLGINIVNLDIEEAARLGFKRVELCLGREKLYIDKIKGFYNRIDKANKLGLPYSIHLPVYIGNWYPYDFFSAFFIDPDEEKRQLSFKLLEINLEELKDCNPDYFVLHFPGISERLDNFKERSNILNESLSRVNALAKRYGVKIYLEYFGSNKNFCDYNEWISKIVSYENLGILTDTGHLYFASILCDFDYMEALNILSPKSDAFHVWTTRGNEAYSSSEYYKKYHHIVPHIEQQKNDGWAFNPEEVIKLIVKQNKPMILEPSIKYRGKEYLIEGIESIREFFL